MRLEWSVFAMEDRSAIFDYIEADSPRAAVTVDDRIEEQVEALLRLPEMGRAGRVEGARELVIQHTPYVVALSGFGGCYSDPACVTWCAAMAGRDAGDVDQPWKLLGGCVAWGSAIGCGAYSA